MGSVVIWIIVACICAMIANEKNRSPFGWFLLGFLFSLIALVVLVLLPRKEA